MELEGGTLLSSDGFKVDQVHPAATEYDALLGVKRKIPYPKAVAFIVVTEFCERFCYYGMRAVLTLYFRNALRYTDETATMLFHGFVMLAYMTPLLGAIIADSFLGKFKTIFFLSIVYAIGNITLASAATPIFNLPMIPISFLGLGLIALGTGGIKPCVSAFGGDQFKIPGQDAQLQQFFYIFYFAVNSGSLISTFVTPILRKDVHCFGQPNCFPLAFGVPAGLMVLALGIFICGRPFYKVKAPKGNVFVQAVGCVGHAICHPRSKKTRFHWLDYADDKYDKEFIEDLKQLLKILVLFIPLPIFWSLFDQQGSTWTLQATRMDGYLFDGWVLKPDQMQVANSFMVLFLIPIFQSLIYPALAKCNLLTNSLQRMGLGGLLAALSFVVAGVVELHLEPTYAMSPKSFESNLNFVNSLPCPVNVSLSPRDRPFENSSSVQYSAFTANYSHALLPLDNFIFEKVPALNYSARIAPTQECSVDGHSVALQTFFIEAHSETAYSILIVLNEYGELDLVYSEAGDDLEKSKMGNAKLRILYTGLNSSNALLQLNSVNGKETLTVPLPITDVATSPMEVSPLIYSVTLIETLPQSEISMNTTLGEVFLETGGSYLIALYPDVISKQETSGLYTLTKPNYVHMLLMLPQYIIITVAELLFSVTGYAFSYTQAPNSMKSVIQSMWLLTNAIGSLIVIIVTEVLVIQRQAVQFFIFSGLMLLATLVFSILACKYTTISTQPTSPLLRRRRTQMPDDTDETALSGHSD